MLYTALSFLLYLVLCASTSQEKESFLRTNLDQLLDNHTRDGIPAGVICNETRWQVQMHGKDEITVALSNRMLSMSQV